MRGPTRLAIALSLLPMLALARCASTPPPPQDDALEVAIAAGRQAMDNHQPAQATPLFTTAYRRALLRDDAAALGDAGYDLAAAQLADAQPQTALGTIARTRVDLAARGVADLSTLDLVEAAALDRLGHEPEAARAAGLAARGTDAAVTARAIFLSGVIADRAGDTAALADAAARLDALAGHAPRSVPRWQRADRDELDARRDLRLDRPGPALAAARAAADLRRADGHDRALRTALRLAASAAAAAGDPDQAAAYRLRAAQSAEAARTLPSE